MTGKVFGKIYVEEAMIKVELRRNIRLILNPPKNSALAEALNEMNEEALTQLLEKLESLVH